MQLTEEFFEMHLPETANVTLTGPTPVTEASNVNGTTVTFGLCYYEGNYLTTESQPYIRSRTKEYNNRACI